MFVVGCFYRLPPPPHHHPPVGLTPSLATHQLSYVSYVLKQQACKPVIPSDRQLHLVSFRSLHEIIYWDGVNCGSLSVVNNLEAIPEESFGLSLRPQWMFDHVLPPSLLYLCPIRLICCEKANRAGVCGGGKGQMCDRVCVALPDLEILWENNDSSKLDNGQVFVVHSGSGISSYLSNWQKDDLHQRSDFDPAPNPL